MTTYVEVIQKKLILPLEKAANTVFTQKYNPFYYHGALPNICLWLIFLTGLLLLVYYQASTGTAYETVKYMTYEANFGNAMRSIHRYAADAMIVFVLIHLFRVWFTDRYREYRILPWLTGVFLLGFMFVAGLTGYMLIWDQDAVALTNVTLNLVNSLPLIGPWLTQLWMGGVTINDYTITTTLFLHTGLPMLMMFTLFLHYMRITRPVHTPPVALIIMIVGGIALASGLAPVELGPAPPPDWSIAGGAIEMDWLYAWPQMLAVQGWNNLAVWGLVLLVPVGLWLLPYLQKKAMRGQYAQVVFENCTGCSLCYNDCPYEAITMVAREKDDGTRFKRLATIDAGRCANCGLCVGACAFKAIDIPRCESTDVLAEIEATLEGVSLETA